MENLTMPHSDRMAGYRVYGRFSRAADAFEAVAWKAPEARRFEDRIANADPLETPTLRDVARAIPEWAVVVGGGLIAALMGLMLGAMLAV